MSISQEQLQKIAQKLSKIPDVNEKLFGNIHDILNYMQLLEQVDTHGVTPTVSVVQNAASLRPDIIQNAAQASELLACSPQKIHANSIVLPNIMH